MAIQRERRQRNRLLAGTPVYIMARQIGSRRMQDPDWIARLERRNQKDVRLRRSKCEGDRLPPHRAIDNVRFNVPAAIKSSRCAGCRRMCIAWSHQGGRDPQPDQPASQ